MKGYLNTVEKYSITYNKWDYSAPLKFERQDASLCLFNQNTIYWIGGATYMNGWNYLNSI